MSTTTERKTILITGANRGVGLGVAKVYLEKGWQVVAAVRDPSKMPKLEGDVVVVKIDSESNTDPFDAVEELKTKHNIHHLNTVFANAGATPTPALLVDTTPDQFDFMVATNVRGPLMLFKAVRPLLTDDDKFVGAGSDLGIMTGNLYNPYLGVYGTTKAAITYLMRGFHYEEPKLKVFSLHPGWLDTDLGNAGAAMSGLDAPPEKLSVAAPAIYELFENATKEETSGYMWK
ncbi:hypothetical protein B9479_000402 [Cryptococcus floricola]|uniref:Uncharacterized protein n=1 Tax=Cryptococcus floricola TaxID=2591691 RepID=A0A5D3BA31_9TREE|nr:hypothetical protein B9479_000402 [Cryptococcus floricola]